MFRLPVRIMIKSELASRSRAVNHLVYGASKVFLGIKKPTRLLLFFRVADDDHVVICAFVSRIEAASICTTLIV